MDCVDILQDKSNLHRQILHHESAVGSSKAASVAQAVRSLNSLVQVNTSEPFKTAYRYIVLHVSGISR